MGQRKRNSFYENIHVYIFVSISIMGMIGSVIFISNKAITQHNQTKSNSVTTSAIQKNELSARDKQTSRALVADSLIIIKKLKKEEPIF